MQQKVLIFGSGGQLGVELCREFERRQWDVQRFDRQSLDVTDADRVEQVIGSANANAVINAAAYNQVDIAEQEPLAAYQANALAVRNLAMACRQSGAQLIHYSTDYVFDGAKGSPYVETDARHPLGAYAVSKLAGELYAQAYLSEPSDHPYFGRIRPRRHVYSARQFCRINAAARGDADESDPRRRRSLGISDLCSCYGGQRTADLVEKRACMESFHIGGGEAISWYRFRQDDLRAGGNLSPPLQPSDEREYRTAARRPKFSALSNQKLEAAGIAPMPPLRQAVADYLEDSQARLPRIVRRSVIPAASLYAVVFVIHFNIYMPEAAVAVCIRRNVAD